MPSGPGTPTLDQLQVFVHVVDAGSFTAAARKLNRALSVISYTVSNLEAQLGLNLFDRTSSRRPQLTEAGRVVLAEARSVVGGVDALRARVAGMLQGLEGELHVVLDSLLSRTHVVDALTAFSREYVSVQLHLHVETLGAVAGLVLDGSAAVGISGPFTAVLDGAAAKQRRQPADGAGRRLPASFGHRAAGRPPARRQPRPRPARHLRPVALHGRAGFQRQRQPYLAVGGTVLQAHAASRRDGLGHDAAGHGGRRHRERRARPARDPGRGRVRLQAGRDLPHRHAAGAGRLLARRM